MIYRNLGKRLQKAREETRLSQEELASLLGITQSALSNYELGKRRLYLANLEQIASVLGKPIAYFLEEEPEDEQEGRSGSEDAEDETTREILRILSELPAEEKEGLLDFIKWRRDRVK